MVLHSVQALIGQGLKAWGGKVDRGRDLGGHWPQEMQPGTRCFPFLSD